LTVSDGKITDIVEKPGPDQKTSNIVNFVFDYFKNCDEAVEVCKNAFSAIKQEFRTLNDLKINSII
jgi:hypothetical protein